MTTELVVLPSVDVRSDAAADTLDREGWATEQPDVAVAFLGAGTMGTALLAGSLRGGLAPDTVWVAARRSERAAELAEDFGVHAITNNAEAVSHCEVVVLAVPPNAVSEVLGEVRDSLQPGAVVVSIADQVSLADLHEHLPFHTAAVRVMPSLVCEVGAGISLVTFDDRCTSAQCAAVSELLARSSQVIETREADQGALAVLSSGGPGYYAYATAAMIDTLTAQGIPANTAQEVAVAAMSGTATWLAKPGGTLEDLQRKVCTPGGAGAKRIAELDRLGVATGITAALTKNVYE
ncbi:MAG: prephenate dehydrogenase/arogenate dehydrogenase family protein [Ancrocorticia sp.]